MEYSFTIHKYTRMSIQKYCYARIQNIGKQVLHGLHECSRCVRKSHRLYNPFVKTIPHKESGLQSIFISNTALPVSTVKINSYEVFCISHLVQEVLILWQWVQILYCELVKHIIVHAKVQRAIWLFCKNS